MGKSKLFVALQTFNKRELQDFRLFLESPYFNQSNTMLLLFDYIRPFHPSFDDKKLEFDLIFLKLKGKKQYHRKFVIDRISDLYQLVEEFLSVKRIKKNPEDKQLLLRKSLLDHQLHQVFFSKIEKEIEKIEAKPRPGWKKNLRLWWLQNELYTHPFIKKFNVQVDIVHDMMDNLDDAYAILKLREGIHYRLRQEIFEEDKSIFLLDAIIEKYKDSKNIVIIILIQINNYFDLKNKKKAWGKLYQLYISNSANIPDEEKLDIVTALINLGYKLALNKNHKFFDKILNLYDITLRDEVWLRYGKLPAHTFRNMVIVGASTGNIEWAERIISNYQDKLFTEDKSLAIYFAKAYTNFYRGNFSIAIDLLAIPKLKRLEDKLSYKSLHARCLYEMIDNQETLVAFLNSFSKFLQKEKLSNERKQAYKNYITILRALNKAKGKAKRVSKNNKVKAQLTSKLDKTSNIIAGRWLEEKIAEL